MSGTTTGATTEPDGTAGTVRADPTARPDPAGPRGGVRISIRTRIVSVIALLVLATQVGAGLLVYALESDRIDRAVDQQIDQEISEFRTLEQQGVDPETQRYFASAERLVTLFLERQVPDEDELLVRYTDGRASGISASRYGEDLLDDPAYRSAVEPLLDVGGTTEIESERHGELWVTAVPVQDTAGAVGASLVIVSFLDGERAELNRTMSTYAAVSALALGLVVVVAALQSGRLLSPIRTLRETLADITARDLGRRIPVQGNDDLTDLTRTVNGMLDRLGSGFEQQRRFLDDAGHELRTPLTVLSGHLELLDTGNQREVDQTRALLSDEVDRMSRLVDDLILLAKSRRPDFVRPGPVDLPALTEALLAKCTGLGERRWTLDGVAEGVAVMDQQRITQAVLQLADNAVKHTDPGDEVGLGSARGEGVVQFWVRDTGDGIPEADRDRVFDRFERAEVRSGDDGFGLGLSIVRAVVVAHDGHVSVADGDGAGTTVVITLPGREA